MLQIPCFVEDKKIVGRILERMRFTCKVALPNAANCANCTATRMHQKADEWQYYISGNGKMTVISTGNKARTMVFQMDDVGYVYDGQSAGVEAGITLSSSRRSVWNSVTTSEGRPTQAFVAWVGLEAGPPQRQLPEWGCGRNLSHFDL
jgi:hypothetical protein